ncbi:MULTISPECIES: hypothetical protein [Brevundimonas]|uniref:hypothetical protein n=1 Tax=Brevundimonas sp. UBA7507 TaxID=1946137 RepID=UPI00257D2F11|nr:MULTISPECIES: hypothetical protein [Brevundimonas]
MPESTKSPAEVLGGDRSPVEQGLIYLIGRDIDRAIANLGYPVGMGIGVGPELAERAASRILDKLTDKALRDLLEVRQASIRGGEA